MYKFRIEAKTIPVKINNNLSLYDACKKTVGIDGYKSVTMEVL